MSTGVRMALWDPRVLTGSSYYWGGKKKHNMTLNK